MPFKDVGENKRVCIKYSMVPGEVPASRSLVPGELAINVADKKVFMATAEGVPQQFGGVTEARALELIVQNAASSDLTLLASNTAVAADGTLPLADPTGVEAGWYYKNGNDIADKINWYYLVPNNPAITVVKGDLDGMHAVVNVRAAGAPFFVVYTKPTGTGDATVWYKSRYVYIVPSLDLSAYIGQTVYLYWGVDDGDFPLLPRVQCTLDPVTTEGPQDPGEEVLFGNISTSTGYAAGHYEFVVNEMGFVLDGIGTSYDLSSVGALAPVVGDTHYVTLDGVNDYISLTGCGSCMDLSAGATWTLGFTVEEGYPGNANTQAPVASGTNYWVLYNGGLHSTIGNDVASLNWNTASYMQGVAAGDKIAIRANGTHVQVWWNGVRKHQATLGTNGVTTGGSPGTLEIGAARTTASAGSVPNWATSVDNLMVCGSDDLTDAELAEFFASNDHALYSFAGTKLTDFVTMGEDAYPAITGELSVVTGNLVNGTASNFVERT